MNHFSISELGRGYGLSEAFRARADAIAMQAHRVLKVDITRNGTAGDNVMQTLSWGGYDRLDLGVDDIILARTILEHPSLAVTLAPYFSDAVPPVAERVRSLFDLSSRAVADKDDIHHLMDDTERALDDCETIMRGLPRSALVNGFQSRDIAGRAAMIDRAPALRHYMCLKDHVRSWVLNPLKIAILDRRGSAHEEEMGPVHSIRISSQPVSTREELMEARSAIAAVRAGENPAGLLVPQPS